MTQLFFGIFFLVTVSSSLMVALSKKAMHAMLWLMVSFFSTACIFVLLKAEFVAAVQVMVYTGGILVLYMFAIMLVDVRDSERMIHFHANRKTRIITTSLVLAELIFLFVSKEWFDAPIGNMAAETAKWGGNSELIGKTLFTDFVLPFELVGIVLLVAILGAVVLGRSKERDSLLRGK